jgi:drug/metabolite transporter (DMT)-like permease
MFSIITLLNKIGQTYLQSLKKDLAKSGFESIVIVTSISWIGVIILFGLLVMGKFSMPTDPLFYVFWLGLLLVATIQFILFLSGLIKTGFFVANSVNYISFVVTIAYAVLFLHESITTTQGVAVVIALIGATLFFSWRRSAITKSNNQGLFLILFSLFISPLSVIFYKAAISHTSSYTQFLTGRLVMDALYYTSFLFILFVMWYRQNPFPIIKTFVSSKTGLIFMIGSAALNLIDSWLIYKLSVINFTILGTVSIVASYVIGRVKYKEQVSWRFIIGGAFIIFGVIFFTFTKAT